MTDVLITGGTGFIGSQLALRCHRLGDTVTVLAQRNTLAERQNCEELEQQGIQVADGSITRLSDVCRVLDRVEVVYHLAAAQHEANVPDSYFRKVNVEGTRNVLQASVEHGVKRFVHGSTIGVYGSSNHGPIHDDSPLEPDNIYGVTKLEAERLVSSFSDQLPTVIVRISETYGPGDRRLFKLFRAIQQGKFVRIGRGTNLHHLVYVGDLIEALRRAAQSDAAVNQSFVVVGPRAISTDEMIDIVAKVLRVPKPGVRLPLWPLRTTAMVLESALRPLGIQPPLHRRRMNFFVKSFHFSGQRARRLLDFTPCVDFEQGAALVADWYRERSLLTTPR